MNILAWGHRVAAREEVAHSGPSMKQESTEATAQDVTHA